MLEDVELRWCGWNHEKLGGAGKQLHVSVRGLSMTRGDPESSEDSGKTRASRTKARGHASRARATEKSL